MLVTMISDVLLNLVLFRTYRERQSKVVTFGDPWCPYY